MSLLTIPSLFDQSDASSFFATFVAANAHRKSFSQRSFSLKIKWPISYIPDLIKGRKKFSIERAIQFGNFVKLDPIDFEKLIYLAIASSHDKEENLGRIKSIKSGEHRENAFNAKINSAKVMLVFTGIGWLKEFATEKNIFDLVAERNVSVEETKAILKFLLEDKIITVKDSVYIPLMHELSIDTATIPSGDYTLWLEFLKFQEIFYAKKPAKFSSFSSWLVVLENSRLEEIKKRMDAFRHWIIEISNIDEQLDSSANTSIYQFDFNLCKLTTDEKNKKLRTKK
jgi:hypothetical protein